MKAVSKKLSSDDPRLTAYALGELPDRERLEIEREISRCPELWSVVEEIQCMARELEEEFKHASSSYGRADTGWLLREDQRTQSILGRPMLGFAVFAALVLLVAGVFWAGPWRRGAGRAVIKSNYGTTAVPREFAAKEPSALYDLARDYYQPVERVLDSAPVDLRGGVTFGLACLSYDCAGRSGPGGHEGNFNLAVRYQQNL